MTSQGTPSPAAVFKADLTATLELLKNMARYPSQVIRHVPQWEIRRFALIQIMLGLVVGLGRGIAKFSLFPILTEPILSTIATMIYVAVFSAGGFYLAQYLTKRNFDFTHFYGVVTLSFIPYGLTRIFEVSMLPFELVGVAGSFLLATMGLSENFGIGRKGLTRIFGALYLCILGIWVAQRIMETRNQYILEKTSSPIDIEEIEKDLSQSD